MSLSTHLAKLNERTSYPQLRVRLLKRAAQYRVRLQKLHPNRQREAENRALYHMRPGLHPWGVHTSEQGMEHLHDVLATHLPHLLQTHYPLIQDMLEGVKQGDLGSLGVLLHDLLPDLHQQMVEHGVHGTNGDPLEPIVERSGGQPIGLHHSDNDYTTNFSPAFGVLPVGLRPMGMHYFLHPYLDHASHAHAEHPDRSVGAFYRSHWHPMYMDHPDVQQSWLERSGYAGMGRQPVMADAHKGRSGVKHFVDAILGRPTDADNYWIDRTAVNHPGGVNRRLGRLRDQLYATGQQRGMTPEQVNTVLTNVEDHTSPDHFRYLADLHDLMEANHQASSGRSAADQIEATHGLDHANRMMHQRSTQALAHKNRIDQQTHGEETVLP